MTADIQYDADALPQSGNLGDRPAILSPVEGEVRGATVQVMGFSIELLSIIDVYEIYPFGVRRFCGTAVPVFPIWTATCVFLGSGPKTVVAQYRSKKIDSIAVHFNFIYEEHVPPEVPVPTLESPPSGEVVDQQVVLGGNGLFGAGLRVYRDFSDVELGYSVVGYVGNEPGPDPYWWRMQINLPPGGVSLTATQALLGKASQRATAVLLKVRPPPLTAPTVTFPTETSVKFSGAGHTGATVEIAVVSGPGGTAPPAVKVTGGQWETTATDWPIGEYSLTATQKVSDNAGGWIESQPYTFTFRQLLRDPTDLKYTPIYRPVFSGKGYTGATVKLCTHGGGSTVAPDARVCNGAWESEASEVWGPTFKRKVDIKQFLNEQESPTWVELSVTIAPLAPGLNEPVQNGMSPQLSGTRWPGAVVNVKFSDSATVHRPSGNSGTWTFRRDTPFAPDVPHTVTVTQTAASQTSPAASHTFVVYAPIPQPVITHPTPNSEVGRDVTVRGRDGMAGATMQLRDVQFGRDLGLPKTLTSNGEWSIDLRTLDFRRYTIDAKQVRNGRPSEVSDPCVFDVVLLPPVIEVPQHGGKLPRTSKLSGTAMPGGRIEIRLEGVAEPLLKDVAVVDGRWEGEVTLPVGTKTIWARQTFESQTSKESLSLTYSVVPAAPVIETPATGEHIGRQVVVSGFGVPGDTVAVRLGNAARTVLGRSPVLEDRTWSVAVAFDQPGGLYGLLAVASCDGFDSADSPERSVVQGTYVPAFELPAAGQWASNPVRFEGRGRQGVGHVVSWFNPDRVWAPNVPVATGGWQGGATQSLSYGGNWCRFKQTLTDNADGATVSDWVESKRFEVLSGPSTEP